MTHLLPRAAGRTLGAALAALAAGPVCVTPAAFAQAVEVTLVPVFQGERFVRPLQLTHVPDGSGRLVVVEQLGMIRWFRPDSAKAEGIVLDLRNRVSTAHNEEGLLSVAFHPRFSETGALFVHYSAAAPRRSVVARHRVSPESLRAEPGPGEIVLEVAQPYGNHNGGQLAFGPDGFLYIGLGDGGSAGDPHGNGQNRGTLLGKILRIDVDHASGGRPYSIPPDNPFAGAQDATRPEIWAYGLRNPWRFSFDRATGALWAGDVGQNTEEEIDRIVKGGNYGWNVMEGSRCHEPPSGCGRDGLELPVAVYGRRMGIAVTGGFAYRGGAIPALVGRYVFGDFGSGMIWSVAGDAESLVEPEPLLKTRLFLSSFGEDAAGELYAIDLQGPVYRLSPGR